MQKQSGISTIGIILILAFFTFCWLSLSKDGNQIKVSQQIQCENKSGMLALTYDLRYKLGPTIGCAGEPDSEGKIQIVWSDGDTSKYSDYELKIEKNLELKVIALHLTDNTNEGRAFLISDITCSDKKTFLTFLGDYKSNNTLEAGCTNIGLDKSVNTTMSSSGNFTGYLNPEAKHELYKFNFR